LCASTRRPLGSVRSRITKRSGKNRISPGGGSWLAAQLTARSARPSRVTPRPRTGRSTPGFYLAVLAGVFYHGGVMSRVLVCAVGALLVAPLAPGCGDGGGDGAPDARLPDASTDGARSDSAAPDSAATDARSDGATGSAQLCSADGWCWLHPLPQGNTLR